MDPDGLSADPGERGTNRLEFEDHSGITGILPAPWQRGQSDRNKGSEGGEGGMF